MACLKFNNIEKKITIWYNYYNKLKRWVLNGEIVLRRNKKMIDFKIDNFDNENGKKAIVINEQRHVIIYIVIFVILITISQYDNIYSYSFNEEERVPDELLNYDAFASATENINNVNTKISKLADKQRIFLAKVKQLRGEEILCIESAFGDFEIPIYTSRDYDIDKGLVPKEFNEYPEISVNVVGTLSTHGVLIETLQNVGHQTYSNKIYIRGNQVIDVGFQKRLTARDNIKYYDNAILIVDTLNTATLPFIRVYDDETGEILFSISVDDLGVDKGFIDSLRFKAVGDHFLVFTSEYNGEVTDKYICFNENGTYEVVSVWDKLDIPDEQKEAMKEYELETNSDCITFEEYTEDNELVYSVKHFDDLSGSTEVRIKLK